MLVTTASTDTDEMAKTAAATYRNLPCSSFIEFEFCEFLLTALVCAESNLLPKPWK